MREHNNIYVSEYLNWFYVPSIALVLMFYIGMVIIVFVGNAEVLKVWTILSVSILGIVALAFLLNVRVYQWLFAKLEINARQVRIKYGKKERAIDFEALKAVRVLFLTIRDDKLIRIDRFILLQKGENRRYYKSQDRYYDIRKDENTIAVWYTEERYQKIMTFWYAAHGKEYECRSEDS